VTRLYQAIACCDTISSSYKADPSANRAGSNESGGPGGPRAVAVDRPRTQRSSPSVPRRRAQYAKLIIATLVFLLGPGFSVQLCPRRHALDRGLPSLMAPANPTVHLTDTRSSPHRDRACSTPSSTNNGLLYSSLPDAMLKLDPESPFASIERSGTSAGAVECASHAHRIGGAILRRSVCIHGSVS